MTKSRGLFSNGGITFAAANNTRGSSVVITAALKVENGHLLHDPLRLHVCVTFSSANAYYNG